MDQREFVLSLVAICTSGAVLITLIMTIRRIFVRRSETPALQAGFIGRVDERLERIEQAIDAMAIEVERVSEGQRFTAKLLADRPAASERVGR